MAIATTLKAYLDDHHVEYDMVKPGFLRGGKSCVGWTFMSTRSIPLKSRNAWT